MNKNKIYKAVLASLAITTTNDLLAEKNGSDKINESGKKASVLEELVVTARRREESLQDVPIAVTAFSPEGMKERQITDAYDLVGNVPGLMVQGGGGATHDVQYWVRGQGVTFGSNPAVVQYYADVPIEPNSNGTGSNLAFFDVESIQVLKGPQGTLFGRPTTGGAVLVNPARPTYDFDGYVEAGMGDYSARKINAAINIPLIDEMLALRIAYNSSQHDGYTVNLTTGDDMGNDDSETYRVSLLFEPADWVSNYTMFQDHKLDITGTAIQPIRVNLNNPVTNFAPSVYSKLAEEAARLRGEGDEVYDYIGWTDDPKIKGHNQIIINTTEFQLGEIGLLGDVSIKNIFSTDRILQNVTQRDLGGGGEFFQTNNGQNYFCAPGVATCSSVDSPVEDGSAPWSSNDFMDHFTNEFQISGAINGLHDWTLGYFYERDKDNGVLNGPSTQARWGGKFTAGALGFQDDYLWEMDAYFGQTTLDLGDFGLENLKLTLGYRYNDFSQKSTAQGVILTDKGAKPNPDPDTYFTAKTDQRGESYTASIEWQQSNEAMYYASYRKGFKQGGINPSSARWVGILPDASIDFEPEWAETYELGAKLDWAFGDIVGRSNIAVFFQQNTDVQLNETYLAGGRPTSQVNNIAESETQGVEVETTVQFTDNLQLNLSYGYLDSEITDWPGFNKNDLGELIPREDEPVSASPKHMLNVSVGYELPFIPFETGSVIATANYKWLDDHYIGYGNTFSAEDEIVDSYGLLDLRLDWKNINGNPVDIGFFVKNATDEVYPIVNAAFFNSLAVHGRAYGSPRTYGFEIRARFGASTD